jgi:hypothetical protein
MIFNKREVSSGQGNLFLKFKDGDSKTGIFRGEIYEYHQVWENGKSQIVSEDHPQAKSRFRANFVIYEDGKFTPKIFEFGLAVYNQLAAIADEYKIEDIKVKITRRGIGMDTTWMILPLLKEPISAKAMAEIESVPLNSLEVTPQSKPKAVKNYAPSSDNSGDEDLPF